MIARSARASCHVETHVPGKACALWPELESANIRPGAVVRGPAGTVYASFLWHDDVHDRLLLSVPSECMGGARPGTAAIIEGATRPGKLAFRAAGIAFIAIDPEDHGRTHPAVVGVGGPSHLATDDLAGTAVNAFTATGQVTSVDGASFVVDLHLPDTFVAAFPGDAVVTHDGHAVGLLLDPPGHGASRGLLMRPAIQRLRQLGHALHLVTVSDL